MRDRSILGLLLVVTACAVGCGDSGATPYLGAESYGRGGGSGASSAFCNTYCGALVAAPLPAAPPANGVSCAQYNGDGHCQNACSWYRDTVCTNEYSAFANCLQTAPALSCYKSTSGTWGLYLPTACNTLFTAFTKCATDNNVGVCPYGSF